MKLAKIASAMLLGGLMSTGAYATNGYFASGYGIQSQGMGGVSIAFPQDSLAAASNPASIGFLGDRLDVGVTYFQPNRSATLTETGGYFPSGSYDGNGTKAFWIPEFGVTKAISKEFSVGLNVYGNGGMNTNYTTVIPQFNRSGNGSTPGVNLEQMFISPTLSWKPVESQSLGVSLIYVNQTFSATGLQNFTGQTMGVDQSSVSPTNVTNRGNSTSTGFGVQLGWLGKITDSLSLGVRYQPKISMSNFGNYSGLFAGGGSFDIPETYGAGIAYNVTKDLTFAADYQNIKYANVPAIANPISNFGLGMAGMLGASNGAGFGWQSINVYKLGANWRINQDWAVRVGYNFNDQPIPSSQTLFNILAPGVITQQASVGATYYVGKEYEISGFYAHGFNQSVSGSYAMPSFNMSGTSKISMYQDSVGLAFGWKY